MIGEIFSFIFAGVAAFLPVLLWAYAFSYIEAEHVSIKRFFLGIFVGSIAVIPVAFMQEILSIFSLQKYNIFTLIASQSAPIMGYGALMILIFGISLITLLLLFAVRWGDGESSARIFLRSVSVFFIVSVFLPLFWWLFAGASNSSVQVSIASATLSGFVSIFLAYFVVAIIEECGKHLAIFSLASPKEIAEDALKFAIFSALGFAFFENILYFSTAFASSGAAGVWFSRSFFSIGVHVVSAVILALPLAYAKKAGLSPSFFRLVLAFIFGILFHAFFDIGLSFGKMWIIPLYLFFGYFYLTKAFYQESSGRKELAA